jgi:acyl carrier protein
MKNFSEKQNTTHAEETVQAWIIKQLAKVIGIKPDQIDPRLPFTTFGLDSLTAFNLTGDLADWLGRDLPATLLWDHPTIVSLSQHLAQDLEQSEYGPSL